MLFSPLLSVAQKNHLLHVWQMIPTWSWILAFVISGEVKILVYQHHCHPYIELRSFSKYILIFFFIAHPPPPSTSPHPTPRNCQFNKEQLGTLGFLLSSVFSSINIRLCIGIAKILSLGAETSERCVGHRIQPFITDFQCFLLTAWTSEDRTTSACLLKGICWFHQRWALFTICSWGLPIMFSDDLMIGFYLLIQRT